jgi:S-adenosylmethionine/arginine decarboxylase-like enzyme
MPFAEDLAPFFNVADFADAATLDGVAVSGIFDNGYEEAFGMTTHEARYTMASSEAASATNASVLVVRSTSYRVRVPQPDGTGVTVLLLERS